MLCGTKITCFVEQKLHALLNKNYMLCGTKITCFVEQKLHALLNKKLHTKHICIILGPVTPAYPEVCCDAFTTGHVCEETFDNAIDIVTNVASAPSCQLYCQARLIITCPQCKHCILTLVLLSHAIIRYDMLVRTVR
jgi:hypothetical protein